MVSEEDTRKYIIDYLNTHHSRWALQKLLKRNNMISFIDNWCSDKLHDYPFGHKLYWFVHNIKEFPTCKICGKEITKPVRSYGEYESCYDKPIRYCSSKCAHSDPQLNYKCVIKWKDTIQKKKSGYVEQQSDVNEDCVRDFIIDYLNNNHNRSMLKILLTRKNFVDFVYLWEKEKLKNYPFGHRLYWFVHKIHDFPICKICGKKILKKCRTYGEYEIIINGYCSGSCLHSDPDIIKKNIETCINNWGVPYPMQSSIIRKKSIDSYIEKHGGDHPSHCPDIRSKMAVGLRKAYRGPIFDKIKKINNYKFLSSKNCFIEHGLQYEYKWLCLKCNQEFYSRLLYYRNEFTIFCPHCYFMMTGHRSFQEAELFYFVKSCVYQCLNVESNNRSIIKRDNGSRLELDIYIPYLKLAFEYNGDYWHSEELVGKNYHEMKTKLCFDKGILLIHVWEHEWMNSRDTKCQEIKQIIDDRTQQFTSL